MIYGGGKTAEQIRGIVSAMGKRGCHNILITRISQETADLLTGEIPLEYYLVPRLAIAFPQAHSQRGNIVVATGGTSDMAAAEEGGAYGGSPGKQGYKTVRCRGGRAAPAAVQSGCTDERQMCDRSSRDGRRPGFRDRRPCGLPVIAVPTSVGYGASFGGLSALLSMLNSCASGCSVVNIDNGFGAGYQASMINQMEGLEEE